MTVPLTQSLSKGPDLLNTAMAAGGKRDLESSAVAARDGGGPASAAVPFLTLPSLLRRRQADHAELVEVPSLRGGCYPPVVASAQPPAPAVAASNGSPVKEQGVTGDMPGASGTSETGGMESPGAGRDRTLVRSTNQNALEDVLALRMAQIHTHGHTLAADRVAIAQSGKRYHVAALARRTLGDAIEDMQFNKDAAQIRRRLVKAAALILAAIDAEDAVAEAKAAAEHANNHAVAEAKAAAEQLHGTARNV